MKSIQSRLLREKFLWVLSAGTIIVFLIFNFLTPLIADDYSYSLGIHSVSDIVVSQYNQYFNWGGRSVAHFFVQFWLFAGKAYFNIANTLVYCAFILLVTVHITGTIKNIKPGLFLAVNLFFWYFVPAWGQNFLWLTGSCNYVWTTSIILGFLVPFRIKFRLHNLTFAGDGYAPQKRKNRYTLNVPLSCLLFVIGILAGWSNENSSAAVLVLLIIYFTIKYINKEKVCLFEILGVLGFLTGFILLVAAPGNYVRAEVIKELSGGGYYADSVVLTLLNRFFEITRRNFINFAFIIIGVSCILGLDLVLHQKRKLNVFSYCYALAALAGGYSMMFSPTFPDRAFLIVFVFLCITLGSILMQFEIRLPEIVKRNAIVIACLVLIVLLNSVFWAGRNITGIYLKWQNRTAYILQEKAAGNLDVAVKAPIPATDRHAALYGLTDISDNKNEWPNTDIAHYFGLQSIQKSDEPLEPLL